MKYKGVRKDIDDASFVLVVCGAGLSADCGIPTYRGESSHQYKTWPPFIRGEEEPYGMAKERRMREDPSLAWGHIFNRMHAFNTKSPHKGYHSLYGLIKAKPHFIFSTNVDGMWHKTSTKLDTHIVEYHGSASYVQCINDCRQRYSRIEDEDFTRCTYDSVTGRLNGTLPTCTDCGELMRQNIFNIGDYNFCGIRRFKQQTRYERFLRDAPKDGMGVVLEIGCGRAIPTARNMTAAVRRSHSAKVIRLNLVEQLESEFDECDTFLQGTALSVINNLL